jgi:hypothetical protein
VEKGALIVLWLLCAASSSQNLPVAPPQRADFEVRWAAPTNPWPATLWVYRIEPNVFSPMLISNVLAITGYTTNDSTGYDKNGVIFSNSKRAGSLSVSFYAGSIVYQNYIPFQPELVNDLPEEKQLFPMTTNLVAKLGISSSELVKKTNSAEPRILYLQHQIVLDNKGVFTTNIWSREAYFQRLLDGVEFIGFDRGGNGKIEFGNHGTILQLWLSWWNVKRDKEYSTVSPQTIMQWIREGKVLPQHIDGAPAPPISDWTEVKSVTITAARPVCLGADKLVYPASLCPYAALMATVHMGTTNFKMEINCPIFNESEFLKK